MSKAMYLSSYALIEPEDKFYLYYPGWLNVWESHLYKNSLSDSATDGWFFKRFGTSRDMYAREMIRKPHYISYIKAIEDAADRALQNLVPRERMYLLKSRTAFIYVDAWGESAVFENISSTLHSFYIDTLPKNILKKFSINDLTCKLRGEKQAFMQALRITQDYIYSGAFDFIIICAAYRAIPFLVFSDNVMTKKKKQHSNINFAVERVGCFIFSSYESSLKVKCGHYLRVADNNPGIIHALTSESFGIDYFACAWMEQNIKQEKSTAKYNMIDLVALYGNSGCMMPTLGWEYIKQRGLISGVMRTICADNFGGYNFFDSWY